MTFFIEWTLKSSLIILVALIATRLMTKQAAAAKHLVLSLAIFASLVVPLSVFAPDWRLPQQLANPDDIVLTTAITPSVVSAPFDIGPSVPTTTSMTSDRMERLAAVIWITGVIACLTALIVGCVRLGWIASASRPMQSTLWSDAASEVSREYRLTRTIRLLQSSNASILATWGFRKPRIVLPAGAEMWPEERIRVVLRHELAHIRRNDWFIQIMSELFRACCWFNPLSWVLCQQLRLQSEYACDDLAVQQGIDPTDYASQLLALAQDLNAQDRAWSGALAMARKSTVERRFTAMLNSSLNHRSLTRSGIIAIGFAAAIVSAPITTFSLSGEKQTAVVSMPFVVTQPSASPVAPQPLQSEQYTGEIVTVQLRNSDVRDFFRFLADFTQKKFVVDPAVQGTVTISAQDIPWDRVLEIVVRNLQLSVKEEGETFLIAKLERGQIVQGVSSSRVTGGVFDPSQLPIPGVRVQFIRPDNSEVRTTTTDDRGNWVFSPVTPGPYRLTFSLPGFKTLNYDQVGVLGADSAVQTNVLMSIAPISHAWTILPGSSVQAGESEACVPEIPTPPDVPSTTGGNISAARLVSQPRWIYPAGAIAARVEGVVVLQTIVGKNGRVLEQKVLSGDPLLVPAVMEAVSRSCYRPTLLNGFPVETLVTVTANFRLQD